MNRIVTALCIVLGLAPGISAASAVSEIASSAFSFTVGDSTLQIRCDANLSLSVEQPGVVRAVVLLHGTGRNAPIAYRTLLESAAIAGVDEGTTWLVAPQFMIDDDIAAYHLPSSYCFWSNEGWKEGDSSRTTSSRPRPVRVSSFEVIDSLITRIVVQAPDLQTIVLAGHSAGAQFVERYAAGSPVADLVRDGFGIEMSYVVANPSSYLYLDPERPVLPSKSQFAVLDSTSIQSCPGYDDYKYGLQNRNGYMSQPSDAQIVSRFRDARVAVLLGELDHVEDPDLDTTCPAMLQGPNRLARGDTFYNYLQHVFGPSIVDRHPRWVVPGVGHDSNGMFTSSCGVSMLFGCGSCFPVGVDTAGTTDLRPSIDSRPNPFRSQTTIFYRFPFTWPRPTVCVYDLLGRLVRTLGGDPDPDGRGSVVWDGRSDTGERLPPGVYLYRLRNGAGTAIERAVMLW